MRIDTPIDIAAVLDSGQTFAFSRHADGYIGVVDAKPVFVRQFDSGMEILCQEGHTGFWRQYFTLDTDYASLLAPCMDDPALTAAVNAFPALRLLRQPVWETVCAFILSANNHQSRIHRLYNALSMHYGEPLRAIETDLYAFPAPDRLAGANEQDLRALGLGYRAPYLRSTAEMIASGFSLELSGMPYPQAHAHLMQLPGVGPKVADCILLFSTGHSCAFPLDVWMLRVMRACYAMQGSPARIKEQAIVRFGSAAGIAQQLLFHAARTGVLDVGEERGTGERREPLAACFLERKRGKEL